MVIEITESQRDKMRYRRLTLKDKLRSIERLVTGRAESYLPLISDENGRVSKEKTERFIAEMLDSLRHYIEFSPNRSLNGDTVKMYESFLRCALMSLRFERSKYNREIFEWKLPSAFEDIVRSAENVEIVGCNSYDSYLKGCYRFHRSALDGNDHINLGGVVIPARIDAPLYTDTDSDFFIGVKKSLDLLDQPRFIDRLPQDTLEVLRRDYEKNHAETPVAKEERIIEPRRFNDPDEMMADVYAEMGERQQIREDLENFGDKTYFDLNHDTRDVISVLRERSEERLTEIAVEWKQNIVFDEDTLAEHFHNFVRLYFDSPDRRYFVEDIENMVDTFLFEHGLSAFSLGDDYAMVNYYVDRMKERIKREIERGRKVWAR